MRTQGVEVGMVAHAGQARHDDAKRAGARLRRLNRVLCVQVHPVQVGQHAEHRLAGLRLQPVQARLEQGDVAAEAVDDEADDAIALRFGEAGQGADDVGEHAAAVDVRHQHHRAVHAFRETHVGDVPVAQVDFGRAARALDHHRLVLRQQARMRFQHRRHRYGLVLVVVARVHLRAYAAMDDDLGAGVARRLEQYRIHVGMRLDAGRDRLQGLSAADLAAVTRDRAVERHVLRLEGRDTHAAPRQQPAQGRDHGALARVRGGALDHQGAKGQGLHFRRCWRASSSFSHMMAVPAIMRGPARLSRSPSTVNRLSLRVAVRVG